MNVVQAAGGLVCRTDDRGSIHLALVHRPAYDDWSFPKGKLEPGESEPDAALREVEEETGLRCRLDEDLGTISYTDGKGRPKIVRYYSMWPDDGPDLHAANEVDEARWVPIDQVASMLTYDHDRELLDRLAVRR